MKKNGGFGIMSIIVAAFVVCALIIAILGVSYSRAIFKKTKDVAIDSMPIGVELTRLESEVESSKEDVRKAARVIVTIRRNVQVTEGYIQELAVDRQKMIEKAGFVANAIKIVRGTKESYSIDGIKYDESELVSDLKIKMGVISATTEKLKALKSNLIIKKNAYEKSQAMLASLEIERINVESKLSELKSRVLAMSAENGSFESNHLSLAHDAIKRIEIKLEIEEELMRSANIGIDVNTEDKEDVIDQFDRIK